MLKVLKWIAIGLGAWIEAEFIQTIRSGVNPHGYKLDPEYIPWQSWAKLTNEELQSLWIYLQSLPALETAFAE